VGLTKKISTSFPFPDRIEAKWEIEKKRWCARNSDWKKQHQKPLKPNKEERKCK